MLRMFTANMARERTTVDDISDREKSGDNGIQRTGCLRPERNHRIYRKKDKKRRRTGLLPSIGTIRSRGIRSLS